MFEEFSLELLITAQGSAGGIVSTTEFYFGRLISTRREVAIGCSAFSDHLVLLTESEQFAFTRDTFPIDKIKLSGAERGSHFVLHYLDAVPTTDHFFTLFDLRNPTDIKTH